MMLQNTMMHSGDATAYDKRCTNLCQKKKVEVSQLAQDDLLINDSHSQRNILKMCT